MSQGLRMAGWALEEGPTFCPSCARARGLGAIAVQAALCAVGLGELYQ